VQPLTARAAGGATLTILPRKVLDGSRFYVRATRLKPKHYYTFMLVGPKAKKDRALLGPVQSDAHGKLAAVLKLPIILHCGKSTVYLLDTKQVLARATVTVTGCTLKGGPGAPPPAPKG
jgi:hypothetical protein